VCSTEQSDGRLALALKPALYKECKRLGVALYERTMVTSLLTNMARPA
jgi:hypothetical protein